MICLAGRNVSPSVASDGSSTLGSPGWRRRGSCPCRRRHRRAFALCTTYTAHGQSRDHDTGKKHPRRVALSGTDLSHGPPRLCSALRAPTGFNRLGNLRKKHCLASRVAAVSVLMTYTTESTKNTAPRRARTCSDSNGARRDTGSAIPSATFSRHPCRPAWPNFVAVGIVFPSL